MSESCRVRAHLLGTHTHDSHGIYPDCPACGTREVVCSGPLVPCLLGVTREAVEKAAPHGAVRKDGAWRPSKLIDPPLVKNAGYIAPYDLLHRLSTQECPECDGKGEFMDAIRDNYWTQPCPICDGTGRVGTCCKSHWALVTETWWAPEDGNEGKEWEPPKLDPTKIPPTDPALLDSLGLKAPA